MGSSHDNTVSGIGADTDSPDQAPSFQGNPHLHGANTQARCKECSMILFQGRCIDCGPTETPRAESAEPMPPAKKLRLTANEDGGDDWDFDENVAHAEAFEDEAAHAEAFEDQAADDEACEDELFEVFG